MEKLFHINRVKIPVLVVTKDDKLFLAAQHGQLFNKQGFFNVTATKNLANAMDYLNCASLQVKVVVIDPMLSRNRGDAQNPGDDFAHDKIGNTIETGLEVMKVLNSLPHYGHPSIVLFSPAMPQEEKQKLAREYKATTCDNVEDVVKAIEQAAWRKSSRQHGSRRIKHVPEVRSGAKAPSAPTR